MTERHIPEGLFERFLRQETSRDESHEIVRHLLTRCPQCSETAYRLVSEIGLFVPSGAPQPGWEEAYEELFSRALAFSSEEERRIAWEKLQGWARWMELEPLSPRERLARVEADMPFQTFGLYSRLLEASRWYSRTDPAEAVDIVRLAVAVAERLDPSRIGRQRTADLQAAAQAELGNACRIAEDFEGARQEFDEAWRILKTGTGDPAEEAHLISLEASYLKDIGDYELAEASLAEALRMYQAIGDTHQQARILLQMGETIGLVQPEQGVAHIQKALTLLDAAREPRLELYAQHDLAGFLSDSGRPEEALAVLERARPLYQQFQEEPVQLRLHWLEAKIAGRLGELAEAERILAQLWEEFRVRNLYQEVVLVTIDLAQILTRKGESARAAQLASECHAIMAGWGLHRDALTAWLVFCDALAQDHVQRDLFERLGDYFRRHWFRPAPFREEEGEILGYGPVGE